MTPEELETASEQYAISVLGQQAYDNNEENASEIKLDFINGVKFANNETMNVIPRPPRPNHPPQ